MAALFLSILGALRAAYRSRADLAVENLALRQQLANLRRKSDRPRLGKSDRAFWLLAARLWSRWADVLLVVVTFPATQPPPPGLDHHRCRARSKVGAPLGGSAVAVPEQGPNDLLPGTHDRA
jgi:hypothetical protein